MCIFYTFSEAPSVINENSKNVLFCCEGTRGGGRGGEREKFEKHLSVKVPLKLGLQSPVLYNLLWP